MCTVMRSDSSGRVRVVQALHGLGNCRVLVAGYESHPRAHATLIEGRDRAPVLVAVLDGPHEVGSLEAGLLEGLGKGGDELPVQGLVPRVAVVVHVVRVEDMPLPHACAPSARLDVATAVRAVRHLAHSLSRVCSPCVPILDTLRYACHSERVP